MKRSESRSCSAKNVAHLKLVASRKAAEQSETKVRCDGKSPARSTRSKSGKLKASDGRCGTSSAIVGNNIAEAKVMCEESEYDDDDDDDDEDIAQTDAECDKEVLEFYDLLKETAPADVIRIGEWLQEHARAIVKAEAPKGLSQTATKLWEMAVKLTAVEQVMVDTGHKLQILSALDSHWGKCTMAADVAGRLLYVRMERKRREEVQACGRPRRAAAAKGEVAMEAALEWPSSFDGVLYFAEHMTSLVDASGSFKKKKDAKNQEESTKITWFNKEVRQAYLELVLLINASHKMAQIVGEEAYKMDGEVAAGAALTVEDTHVRYDTALESMRSLYPLVAQDGRLSALTMTKYKTFRNMLRTFLSVYKEFVLQGEMVYEQVTKGYKFYGVRTLGDDATVEWGYRVRGECMLQVGERKLQYWSSELGELKLREINKRVDRSQKNRVDLKKFLANVQMQRQVRHRKKVGANNNAKKKAVVVAVEVAVASNKQTASKKQNQTAKRGKKRSKNGKWAEDVEEAVGVAVQYENEAAVTDVQQIRSQEFDYTMVQEAPCNSYLSVVMLKDGKMKPKEESMVNELSRPGCGQDVGQFMSVAGGGGFAYTDICSLTYNLHGHQNRDERNRCRELAEEQGVPNMSIPGGSSYLSRDVNALYEGTAEHKRLVDSVRAWENEGDQSMVNDDDYDDNRPLGFDVGAAVQGVYQCAKANDLRNEEIEKRGNIQFTVGISNHNYDKSKSAESGEVAAINVQNEVRLHKYFPNRGCNLGRTLARLSAMRDVLARERGDGEREYNDVARNQVFSGRTGTIFGGASVGFENVTIALTGNSRTLKELLELQEDHLDTVERAQKRARRCNSVVATQDHGDHLNPDDPAYSRVVLGKWRIHLARDEEGEEVVVTLIGNHRRSVETYETKMKGIRSLRQWYSKTIEARRADEEGSKLYDADGDYAAQGAEEVRVGFVPEETYIHEDSLSKFGPGAFVSYSRPLTGTEMGPWRRHRSTILMLDGGSTVRQGNSKRKAKAMARSEQGAQQMLVTKEELERLEAKSQIYGELCMKRADFNRFAEWSGCIWGADQLRDRFDLNTNQMREVAVCIFWHSRSRAIFLVKCQVLLDRKQSHHAAFDKVAQKGRKSNAEQGHVGYYIMESMVKSKLMNRMASDLIRAVSLQLVWKDGGNNDDDGMVDQDGEPISGFTPKLVADSAQRLKQLLKAAEKISDHTSSTTFLTNWQKKKNFCIKHVGMFVLPQVLPICYLLGLTTCDPRLAAEAPILDKTKKHGKYFVEELGVDSQHLDLSMLVVALQFGTVPLNVENAGCENQRKQKNVHDFMLKGQIFYDLRPVPGCNYRHPQYQLFVKKWGPDGVWVPAVRDRVTKGWRHPDR